MDWDVKVKDGDELMYKAADGNDWDNSGYMFIGKKEISFGPFSDPKKIRVKLSDIKDDYEGYVNKIMDMVANMGRNNGWIKKETPRLLQTISNNIKSL